MRRFVGMALIAALGSATAAPLATRGVDTSPPQVYLSTVLPAVATSYSMPYSATYSDNVELAYVRTGSSQPFVFMAEGIKTYQSEDTLLVPLGRTVTRTLMAVDTSGNVGKKTITIAPPEVPFKDGFYIITGVNVFPAGFDCRPASLFPSPYYPMDGQPATSLGVGYPTYPNNPPGTQPWSVADGYRPSISTPSGNGVAPSGNIPLNATSLSFDSFAGGASGGSVSYESKFVGTAQVILNSPRTIQLSYRMSCNVNNTGWVNGTTVTFTGQLAP